MDNDNKRIGMVTLYSNNFGSCLQAYALYGCIKNFGCHPTLIKYQRMTMHESLLHKFFHMSIKTIWHALTHRKSINVRKSCFNVFRSSMFTFTCKEYLNNDERKELNSQFDAFVCGSDMMWCEAFEKDWSQFFLQFADKEKRIAYAPSFGINQISEENHQRCLTLLSGFPASRLSCRDVAGVRMLEEKFGLYAYHTLDPTMLLDKHQWNSIVKNDLRWIKKSYTLTYLFGGTSGGRKNVFKQVKKWELGDFRSIDGDRSDTIKGQLGPLEFVRLFRDTAFVITDTFHGLIFSLIFEKPFVVLTREDGVHWTKYSDRIVSTLEMLNISERYLDMNLDIPECFQTLDYTEINSILSVKRKDSLMYLHDALEEVLNGQSN